MSTEGRDGASLLGPALGRSKEWARRTLRGLANVCAACRASHEHDPDGALRAREGCPGFVARWLVLRTGVVGRGYGRHGDPSRYRVGLPPAWMAQLGADGDTAEVEEAARRVEAVGGATPGVGRVPTQARQGANPGEALPSESESERPPLPPQGGREGSEGGGASPHRRRRRRARARDRSRGRSPRPGIDGEGTTGAIDEAELALAVAEAELRADESARSKRRDPISDDGRVAWRRSVAQRLRSAPNERARLAAAHRRRREAEEAGRRRAEADAERRRRERSARKAAVREQRDLEHARDYLRGLDSARRSELEAEAIRRLGARTASGRFRGPLLKLELDQVALERWRALEASSVSSAPSSRSSGYGSAAQTSLPGSSINGSRGVNSSMSGGIPSS